MSLTQNQTSVIIGLFCIVTILFVFIVDGELEARRPTVTHIPMDIVVEVINQRARLVTKHNRASTDETRKSALLAIKQTDSTLISVLSEINLTEEVIDVEQ